MQVNEHNQYNPLIKKYFNENTGNWVNSIRDKVMIEKYLRYEFEEFRDTEIISEFGWGRKEGVGYFLTILLYGSLNRNKNDDRGYVYLSDRFMDILLGRLSRDLIIRRLQELDLIHTKEQGRNQYDYNKFFIQYKIVDANKFCNVRLKYIRNNILTNSLDKYYQKLTNNDKYDKYMEYERNVFNKIHRTKQIDFLSLKGFGSKGLNTTNRDIISANNNGLYIDLLTEGNFTRDNYGGRLYSPVTNIKKEKRRSIRFKSDTLVEIDLKYSHISNFYLLAMRLKSDTLKLKGVNLNVLRKYKYLLDEFIFEYKIWFGSEKSMDFYNWNSWILKIDQELMSIGDNREIIKREILKLLSTSTDIILKSKSIIKGMSREEVARKIFTNGGYQFIKNIKEEIVFENGRHARYTNMNKLLTILEVDLMNKVFDKLIERNIPYLSIFDGFICDYDDLEGVKLILKEISEDNYFVKFGIDYYRG